MKMRGHVKPDIAPLKPFDIGQAALKWEFTAPLLDLIFGCLEGEAEFLDGMDSVLGGNLFNV